MTGCWLSCLFACYTTEAQSSRKEKHPRCQGPWERGCCPTILTVQAWSVKDLLDDITFSLLAGHSGQSRADKIVIAARFWFTSPGVHLARSQS